MDRSSSTLALRMASTDVSPRPAEGIEAESAPELSVVVTLLDEADTLDELHGRTVAALDSLERSWEVIYVDDGSQDGTFAALERLHAGDSRIRAVRFKRNFGQHPAMHAGLSRARGEIVVTMDGDLQNPPEDIVAPRRGRGRRVRRRQRPPRGPTRLLGAHAAVHG